MVTSKHSWLRKIFTASPYSPSQPSLSSLVQIIRAFPLLLPLINKWSAGRSVGFWKCLPKVESMLMYLTSSWHLRSESSCSMLWYGAVGSLWNLKKNLKSFVQYLQATTSLRHSTYFILTALLLQILLFHNYSAVRNTTFKTLLNFM